MTDTRTDIVYSFDEIEFRDGIEPESCEWFALCGGRATHLCSHPALEWVPVCDTHAHWNPGS